MHPRQHRLLCEYYITPILICLCFACWMSHVAGLSEETCPGINIRNDPMFKGRPDRWRMFANCTVLEGDVHYFLSTGAIAHKDYAALALPNVREITGSILIYLMNGIQSLDILFPNLRVIRGQTLIYNYALVLFENAHLEEIGLSNLVEISHGGVRIAKNPKLCFANMLNWSSIVKDGKENIIIRENKNSDQCESCKQFDNAANCEKRPDSSSQTSLSACWNSQTCQLKCPDSLNCGQRTCNASEGFCCHPECIGGCVGQNDSDCLVCRSIWHQGRCLAACPPDLYTLYGRRCVTEKECINQKPEYDDFQVQRRFKPIQGCCTLKCPNYYMEDENDGTKCIKCQGPCKKSCRGGRVSNIQEAELMRGCEVLIGHLEITIRTSLDEQTTAKVADALASISEVTDYVKVAFCSSLLTLNMLSGLRRIKGEQLWNDMYALSVFENEHLTKLWTINKENPLHLDKGRVQFHNNPVLCHTTVLDFVKQISGLKDAAKPDEHDVSIYSNGNKAVCEEHPITLQLSSIDEDNAVLNWSGFNTTNMDERYFLGYRLYYKHVTTDTVSIYENRDACRDSWKLSFVDPKEPGTIITDLKPYTRYAFYLNTLMINSPGARGGISNVVYATTLFSTPTVPQLYALDRNSSALMLSWMPPLSPKGEITHYQVEISEATTHIPKERDYCADPPRHDRDDEELKKKLVPLPTATPAPIEVVQVSNGNAASSADVADMAETVAFENFIQNAAFQQTSDEDASGTSTSVARGMVKAPRRAFFSYHMCGRSSTTEAPDVQIKRRRSVDDAYGQLEEPPKFGILDKVGVPQETATTSAPNLDETAAASSVYVFRFTPGTSRIFNITERSITLTNLAHFTNYIVKIQACQNVTQVPNYCSPPETFNLRTEPIPDNDRINQSSIVVTTNEQVADGRPVVRWDPPPYPNGAVLAYRILITQVDAQGGRGQVECRDVSNFTAEDGYLLPDHLHAGKYNLQISVVSLALTGPYTDAVAVTVPGPESYLTIIISVAVSGLVICVILFGVGVWFLYRQRRRQKQLEECVSSNPFYWTPYQADDWELLRDDICLLEELGSGSFGKVLRGEGRNVRTVRGDRFGPCAVKMLKADSNIQDQSFFLREATILKQFDTEYIVKLYGVVSNGQPGLIVLELMENGNLREYLRKRRPNSEENVDGLPPPSLLEVLRMTGEVADGMAYLEYKNFVHGDLAARNCMVTAMNSCKIGDFGMARDMEDQDYYRLKGRRMMPVRWMAPETFQDSRLSSKSDVWAFGVLLWEIATFGNQPYHPKAHEEVIEFVCNRNLLPKPRDCPEILWRLMSECWQFSPKERPSFLDIVTQLLPQMTDRFRKVSYYCSHGNSSAGAASDTGYCSSSLEQKKPVPCSDGNPNGQLPSAGDLTGGQDSDEAAGPESPLNPPRGKRASATSNGSPRTSPDAGGDASDVEMPVCNNNRRGNSYAYVIPRNGSANSLQNCTKTRRASPQEQHLVTQR